MSQTLLLDYFYQPCIVSVFSTLTYLFISISRLKIEYFDCVVRILQVSMINLQSVNRFMFHSQNLEVLQVKMLLGANLASINLYLKKIVFITVFISIGFGGSYEFHTFTLESDHTSICMQLKYVTALPRQFANVREQGESQAIS